MANKIGQFFDSIPVITKNLIIINVIMWLATVVLRGSGFDLEQWLGLHSWQGSDFNPAQIITYMFMHDSSSIMHLFFNMFSLWMFGVTLERVLGPQRYLFFYISCGIGAALVQELVWMATWRDIFVQAMAASNNTTIENIEAAMATGQLNNFIEQFHNMMVTVGASGAVFGILVAFGMLFPNLQMFIIPFPFPIKAKWVVIGYAVIELFFGVTGTMNSVAHYAHLGGMLFAFIMIYYWKKKGLFGGLNGGF